MAERNTKSKKITMMHPIIIIVISISIIIILWFLLEQEDIIVDDWDAIQMEQEKIVDGWVIQITATHKAWEKDDGGFPLSDVCYQLTNNSEGCIEEINGKFNENGTVIFFDNNNDNKMNVGDTFFIYDNPNNDVKSGYHFWVMAGTARYKIELE